MHYSWIKFAGGVVAGIAAMALLSIGVDHREWLAERYPSIAQLPREILWAVLLTAFWIPQVVSSFRRGRRMVA
jgi:hypothetical protein